MKQVFYKNLSGEEVLQAIEKHSMTLVPLTPIFSYKLSDCPNIKKYNLSSLKIMVLGGTSVNVKQLKKLNSVFSHVIIMLSYGTSEVGWISCLSTLAITDQSKWNSLPGLGLGVSLKVVDTNTEEILGPNKNGEIRVKTPFMMKSYYKLNSEDVFDKDGYYKTGDIGYYDKNQFIYIIDRIKESFKYNGIQVTPSLIESVVMTHPAVEEAAVIPITADKKEIGELAAACVVLKPNQQVSEEDIQKFVDEKVSDFEKLRGGVYFMKNIPRTPTGKIIRRDIKSLLNIA